MCDKFDSDDSDSEQPEAPAFQMFLDEHFPDVSDEHILGILTEAPAQIHEGPMTGTEEVDEPDEVFIRNLIARCQERPDDPEMIQYKNLIYLAAQKIGVPTPD